MTDRMTPKGRLGLSFFCPGFSGRELQTVIHPYNGVVIMTPA